LWRESMSSSICLHQLLQRHFKLCGRKCLWSNCDVVAAFASRHRGKLRKESVPPRYELGICRIQFYSVDVAQSCSVGSTDCEVTPMIVYTSPGRGVDHPPHLVPRLKRVALYLYSPSGPLRPVVGWTLLWAQCMIVL
jgi:hypothetical protein